MKWDPVFRDGQLWTRAPDPRPRTGAALFQKYIAGSPDRRAELALARLRALPRWVPLTARNGGAEILKLLPQRIPETVNGPDWIPWLEIEARAAWEDGPAPSDRLEDCPKPQDTPGLTAAAVQMACYARTREEREFMLSRMPAPDRKTFLATRDAVPGGTQVRLFLAPARDRVKLVRTATGLTVLRGSAGLLRALARLEIGRRRRALALMPAMFAALADVERGTREFGARIVAAAARRLRALGAPARAPKVEFAAPLAGERTDPEWYRTRARAGSLHVRLMRALKGLAVERLPLHEARLGRAESPLFSREPEAAWDAALAPAASRWPRTAATAFDRVARRWLNLLCGRAVWLALRLAEVAVDATGDPESAAETLRVCGVIATRPRLYDPFNTLAALLEAFHLLALWGERPLSRILWPRQGGSDLAWICLKEPGEGKWRSARAMELAAAGLEAVR